MRARLAIFAAIVFCAFRVNAQTPSSALDATRLEPRSPATHLSSEVIQSITAESSTRSEGEVTGKSRVKVSGPLSRLFKGKAKSILRAPVQFLEMINPFAPADSDPGILRVDQLSSRPWSATVGWHNSPSAAENEVTHESSLGLMSVSR